MSRAQSRHLLQRGVALAVLFLAALSAPAQQVGLRVALADPAAERARRAAAAAAPHLAERYGVAPLAELGPAAVEAPDRLAELQAWNQARRVPRQNGFARPLPAPRRVDLAFDPASPPVAARDGGVLAQTTFSTVAWGGRVRVAGADRVRIHLSRVELPEGARLWVHGAGVTAGPFGDELVAPDGGLWTPSVGGEELALDVEAPAALLAGRTGYGFTIDEALELVAASGESGPLAPAKATSCEVDASCFGPGDFPGYNAARHAVARLFFVDGHQAFDCTGQLLNDAAGDGIPYLLTANHCISTQAAAATLQAVFDDYTPSCNGTPPDLSTLPTASGATLLVTGDQPSASDFSLLRLASLPGGRTFLGWNSAPHAAADGTLLYRLSHPGGGPQMYSVTRADSRSALCTRDLPLSRYIYSDLGVGAASPGSSGAAAMLASGLVVGQLYGGCGDSNDPCNPEEHPVDGAFAASFAQLKAFLAAGPGKKCTPSNLALCLVNKRFQVQVTWSNQFAGTAGVGHAIVGSDEAGYFYFTDPSNFELIVKILDFGGVFKVFYGELTDLQFTIVITDTQTGRLKTYTNTPGNCGAIDESAFAAAAADGTSASPATVAAGPPTTPVSLAGPAPEGEPWKSCVPDGGTLCLLGRRFAVSVTWMNQFSGASGAGKAKALSNLSGLFGFGDLSDVELVLKVVQFSDRIAFFYAALSDFAYDITVADTIHGSVKTYHNPAGTYCGGLDNEAFPP